MWALHVEFYSTHKPNFQLLIFFFHGSRNLRVKRIIFWSAIKRVKFVNVILKLIVFCSFWKSKIFFSQVHLFLPMRLHFGWNEVRNFLFVYLRFKKKNTYFVDVLCSYLEKKNSNSNHLIFFSHGYLSAFRVYGQNLMLLKN